MGYVEKDIEVGTGRVIRMCIVATTPEEIRSVGIAQLEIITRHLERELRKQPNQLDAFFLAEAVFFVAIAFDKLLKWWVNAW